MTEIPEHLLKRAQAAREKAAPAEPVASEPAAEAAPADSRIPEHLLQRSKAAKAAKEGGEAEAPSGGGAVAVAEKVGAVVAPERMRLHYINRVEHLPFDLRTW